MVDKAFQQRLRGIFVEEAREHLAQIDAGLVALEQATAPAAMVVDLLKVLHTLKGAARAVDEGALERLCHALEGVLAKLREGAALPAAEQFDLLHQATGAASRLLDEPGPRSRNQATQLARQLDGIARPPVEKPATPVTPAQAQVELPTARPEASGAGIGPIDAGQARSGTSAESVPVARPDKHSGADRIRVNGRSIDAVRTHAEALLPVELKLRHHARILSELASDMAQARSGHGEAATSSGSTFDLACSRLAEEIARTASQLHEVRARLSDAVLETALVPFAAAVEGLPALVRNLARTQGKQVRLELRDADIGIDRRILGVIREALIHLVTNAVDHAIELPAGREMAGKSATGCIEIALVRRDARLLVVRVSDDGAGIDAGALAEAAGHLLGQDGGALAKMSEPELLRLALRAGVSTRTEVTSVSGRGMGLAIVADKVAAAGGQVLIETQRGVGSTFELSLPAGVATLRVLVIEVGGARYALPLAGMESVHSAVDAAIRTVEGHETILADSQVLPLVRLATLFGRPQSQPEGRGVVLVARVGPQAFGILADAIVAEQDVLPKRLGPLLPRVRYISAAAQLGDGMLVPVVALADIASYGLAVAPSRVPVETGSSQKRLLVVEDSVTSRLLLKHILEEAGYKIDTAVDGIDALSRLRGARYDAVVTDVEMPNMDGLALTAAIRADLRTAELPVILVTSLQTPEQRAAGLRAGADAYFTKGAFDQDLLLATVRRVAGTEGT